MGTPAEGGARPDPVGGVGVGVDVDVGGVGGA